MVHTNCSYLLRVQFLGFRFSGWQMQPGQKTIEEMLTKTIEFVLPGRNFKILGAGRTDAKVSANKFGFQLSISEALPPDFIDLFNANLPSDIRALSIKSVPTNHNPLEKESIKYYLYLFSFGEKAHPFSASMVYNEPKNLDIELMKPQRLLAELQISKYLNN